MINPGEAQEKKWETEKQDCLIRYYVRNPELERSKLKKMDSLIKRDSKGRVAKNSMELYRKMEEFSYDLNAEKFRNKKK